MDAPPNAKLWPWLAWLLLVAALAGVLRRDALAVPLLADDYVQHAMLEGRYPGDDYAPWDLYAFVRPDAESQLEHLEHGSLPWWSVVHGDPDADSGTVVFAVWRPLSSLTLALDHQLFALHRPHALLWRHLHSLLWLGLTIVAAGLVLGRAFDRRLASVAVLLLAVDASLVIPLAWLANRCVLICASFGLLGLWAHLGWRGGKRRMLIVEVVCMSLALAAGEYGLLAVAYVIGWELVGASGGSLGERARALLPALVPALIYMVMHRSLGYGTFGEAYVDMFGDPLRWASLAAERLPQLATAAFWAVPAETAGLGDLGMRWLTRSREQGEAPADHLRLCAIALMLAAIVLWLIRKGLSADERRALAGLGLGALLGLIPVTAAPAQGRLLVLASLGASALVAAVLVAGLRMLRDPKLGWTRRLLPVPFSAILLIQHGVFDLRMGQRAIEMIHGTEAPIRAAFAQASLEPRAIDGRDVIVVNAVDLPSGIHGSFVFGAHGWPAARSWRTLAMGPYALSVSRPRADTLELWAVQGAWLSTTYELNFRRSNQPLHVGDVRERGHLRVEVLDELDGHPTKIRVRFPESVDESRYLFLVSTKDGLRPWRPPRVGKVAVAPRPRLPTVLPGQRVEFDYRRR